MCSDSDDSIPKQSESPKPKSKPSKSNKTSKGQNLITEWTNNNDNNRRSSRSTAQKKIIYADGSDSDNFLDDEEEVLIENAIKKSRQESKRGQHGVLSKARNRLRQEVSTNVESSSDASVAPIVNSSNDSSSSSSSEESIKRPRTSGRKITRKPPRELADNKKQPRYSKPTRQKTSVNYRPDASSDENDKLSEDSTSEKEGKKRSSTNTVTNTAGGEATSEDSEDEQESGDAVQYRIQHILRHMALVPSEWVKLCDGMITHEITRGSVWKMTDEEFYSKSKVPLEKFQIKWQHASYLHLSWETEEDLLTLVGPTAKAHLSKYRQRVASGIDLFDDLRHGEYFAPQALIVERILDVNDNTVNIKTIDWKNAVLPSAESSCHVLVGSGDGDQNDVVAMEVEELNANETAKVKHTRRNGSRASRGKEGEHVVKKARTVITVSSESEDNCDAGGNNNEDDNGDIDTKKKTENVSEGEEKGWSSDNQSDSLKRKTTDSKGRLKRTRGNLSTSTSSSATMPSRKSNVTAECTYLHSASCFVTVKWEGLPYADSTFEDINDLIKSGIEYEKPLRSFYQREQFIPAKNVANKRIKRTLDAKFMSSSEVPLLPCVSGTLRDYQWEGVRWLLFNWSQKRNR